MKKTYLVKKNPNMPDSKDNWIVMNGFEFARFMETAEGQSRKDNFGQLDSCGDGDDIMVVECGAEKSKEWRAEKDAHDYLVEQEIESGIETLSFNALDSEEEEVTGEELMVDTDCDVVADVMKKIDREKLSKALASLAPDEYELIIRLFSDVDNSNLVSMAEEMGVYPSTIMRRRNIIMKKIKKHF